MSLTLVAKLDAEGRHDAAVDALAQGVREGNVEAMTLLGKRLLVGDRAPLLPREAVGFLMDAANAGSGEAAERIAVLAAIGAHGPQNWSQALDALTLSAELGWAPAHAQLRTLASDTPSASAPEHLSWKQLASSIEEPGKHATSDAVVLSADPSVRSFPNLITPAVCDWLINRARPKLTRALVYDSTSGHEKVHQVRGNSAAAFNLIEMDLVQAATQIRIARACDAPLQNLEPLSVLHYEPGEQFDDHFDFVDPGSAGYARELALHGQRSMTVLIYLNDDYEAGETDFPRLSLRHRGRLREGLCFVNAHRDGTPDMRMLHAGRAPSRGEKWVVSQFVRSRAILGT